MVLQKWQRNEIFEAVEKAGFPAEEFTWEAGSDTSVLRHGPSEAHFVFGGDAGNYVTRYRVGDWPVQDRTSASHYGLMQEVTRWLIKLRDDIDTPDLWAQLQGSANALAAATDDRAVENTPFTPAEQDEIAAGLRELKDYVGRTHSLSEAQMQLLEEKLDELAAAAGRIGRKDWALMATGLVVTYAFKLALPPETATDLVQTLLTGIGGILGDGPPGLRGG